MVDEDALLEERATRLVDSHEALLRDLIALRQKHALSQEAVAERMGVTQPTVAAFERYDSNPTLASIRRYAMAVGAVIDHQVIDHCVGSDERWIFADLNVEWSEREDARGYGEPRIRAGRSLPMSYAR